jgi:hypothetical protein
LSAVAHRAKSEATKQSIVSVALAVVASRSLSSGAHSRDPLARRHFDRIADAARIVDRAVESARIRRPRKNAAHAGILGRRYSGSGEKTQDRNARECHSAGHPSARSKQAARAFIDGDPSCPFWAVYGKNLEGRAVVPMLRGESASKRASPRQRRLTRVRRL